MSGELPTNTGFEPQTIRGEGGILVSGSGHVVIDGSGINPVSSGSGALSAQVIGNTFSGTGVSLTSLLTDSVRVAAYVEEVDQWYEWVPGNADVADDWRTIASANPQSAAGRWKLVGDTLKLASLGGGLDNGARLTSAAAAMVGGTIVLRETNAVGSPEEFVFSTPFILPNASVVSGVPVAGITIVGSPGVRFRSTLTGAMIEGVPSNVGAVVSTTLTVATTGTRNITTAAALAPGETIQIQQSPTVVAYFRVVSTVGLVATLDRDVLQSFIIGDTVKTANLPEGIIIYGNNMILSGDGTNYLLLEGGLDGTIVDLGAQADFGAPTGAAYKLLGCFDVNGTSLNYKARDLGPLGIQIVSSEELTLSKCVVEDIIAGAATGAIQVIGGISVKIDETFTTVARNVSRFGLQLDGACQSCRVSNCTFEGASNGIEILSGNLRSVIDECSFHDNGIGVNNQTSTQNRISDCTFFKSTIVLQSTVDCAIESCSFLGVGIPSTAAIQVTDGLHTSISDANITTHITGITVAGDVDMTNINVTDCAVTGITITGAGPTNTNHVRVVNLTARAGAGTVAGWTGILSNPGFNGQLEVHNSRIDMTIAGQTAIKHNGAGSGVVILTGNQLWTESVAGTFGYVQPAVVGSVYTLRRSGRCQFSVTTPITIAATGFSNINTVIAPAAGVGLPVPWPDLQVTDHINLQRLTSVGAGPFNFPSVATTPGVNFTITFDAGDAGSAWQYQVNS
jgi:hypothetical protein